jgi:transcriptional regulator with XRE-family HTH domain
MHYNLVRIPLIDVEAFANQLGDAREARSMTLQRFAKEVGVSTAAVWCWEKDRARPPPGKMKRIASVLKVTEVFREPVLIPWNQNSTPSKTTLPNRLHQTSSNCIRRLR